MSTRCQIILKEKGREDELRFYKHEDGYPEGVREDLNEFCDRVNKREIRNNIDQSSGWLVLIGARNKMKMDEELKREGLDKSFEGYGWKASEYEPCGCKYLHGDIEYLYIIEFLPDGKAEWRQASDEEWKERDSGERLSERIVKNSFLESKSNTLLQAIVPGSRLRVIKGSNVYRSDMKYIEVQLIVYDRVVAGVKIPGAKYMTKDDFENWPVRQGFSPDQIESF